MSQLQDISRVSVLIKRFFDPTPPSLTLLAGILADLRAKVLNSFGLEGQIPLSFVVSRFDNIDY
jgi:hypothetical protein